MSIVVWAFISIFRVPKGLTIQAYGRKDDHTGKRQRLIRANGFDLLRKGREACKVFTG
jgi:hypothetical protein